MRYTAVSDAFSAAKEIKIGGQSNLILKDFPILLRCMPHMKPR